MKKLILLLLGVLLQANASAQNLKTRPSMGRTPFGSINAHSAGITPSHKNAARTTSLIFATEDFGSGTATSLPTGWTAGSFSGGTLTWQWRLAGDGAQYGIGAIQSTTSSNGFMMYNSDSIGNICGCSPSGWLQSPAYNCSAHTSVSLNFEEYFLSWFDSCVVWVGTNNSFAAGTYTSFPVPNGNNGIINSNFFTANPYTIHLNISAAAAGKPAVYIRFVYYATNGLGYSWMVDDMSLSETTPVDLALEKTNILYCKECANQWELTGIMPVKLMDSLYPITYINNYGQANATNDTVTATIYNGSAIVYNKSLVIPNIDINGADSAGDFTNLPGFYTQVTGDYLLVCTILKANDGNLANNTDSFQFAISDTVMSQNAPGAKIIAPVYSSLNVTAFVHNDTLSQMVATGFNIGVNLSDTLTSVSVTFDTATEPGQTVGVQIYKGYLGNTLTYIGSTVFRPISATDISSGNADFAIDSPLSLSGGSTGENYVAVVKCSGCNGRVVLSETFDFLHKVGYMAFYDMSDPANDGDTTHLFDNLPNQLYGDDYTAMVRLNFGAKPTLVPGLPALSNLIGNPYPNPANNQVTIPITLNRDNTVAITLTDILGHTVKTQTFYVQGGRAAKAIINTSELEDGIYIYTLALAAGGDRYCGSIAIAH